MSATFNSWLSSLWPLLLNLSEGDPETWLERATARIHVDNNSRYRLSLCVCVMGVCVNQDTLGDGGQTLEYNG